MISTIHDSWKKQTSAPIMTFTWIAIANILTFKLTITHNYYLNSNYSTILSLTSTLIMVILDKY